METKQIKTCSKCNEEKDLTEFSFKDKKKNRYEAHCKTCSRLRIKSYAEKIKGTEKHAVKIKKSVVRNKIKRRGGLAKIKTIENMAAQIAIRYGMPPSEKERFLLFAVDLYLDKGFFYPQTLLAEFLRKTYGRTNSKDYVQTPAMRDRQGIERALNHGNRPLPDSEDFELDLIEGSNEDDQEKKAIALCEQVKIKFSHLKNHATVFILIHLQQMTQREVAYALGLHEVRINQIIHEVYDFVKKLYEDDSNWVDPIKYAYKLREEKKD